MTKNELPRRLTTYKATVGNCTDQSWTTVTGECWAAGILWSAILALHKKRGRGQRDYRGEGKDFRKEMHQAVVLRIATESWVRFYRGKYKTDINGIPSVQGSVIVKNY